MNNLLDRKNARDAFGSLKGLSEKGDPSLFL